MASPELERRKWHLKKEISIGDLIAFSSAALAVVYAYTTLDKRVSILEVDKTTQSATDKRQDDDAVRYQARIEVQLAEINRKMDRVLERGR